MMNTRIKVSDYYNDPSYYSVMPQIIFNVLEDAMIKGDEYVEVDASIFDKMIIEHQKKMGNR